MMWPLGKKLSNCLVIFAVLGVALALFFFFREGEEKLFLVEEEGGQPLSVVVASSPIWTYTGEKDGWVTYIYVRDPNRPNGHPCKRVGFVVIEKDIDLQKEVRSSLGVSFGLEKRTGDSPPAEGDTIEVPSYQCWGK